MTAQRHLATIRPGAPDFRRYDLWTVAEDRALLVASVAGDLDAFCQTNGRGIGAAKGRLQVLRAGARLAATVVT